MANLVLYTHSFDSTPYSFPCYDLNFGLALQYSASTASNLTISNNTHAATTGDDNYYGFSFSCKPIWNITDPETQETTQYNLLEDDLPAPFMPFPAWKQTTAEDGYMDWDGGLTQVSMTPTMLEPDDWQDNFLSYYTRSNVDQASYTYNPNNVSNWISFRDAAVQDGRTVWKSNIATGLEFMVRGGLFPFSFRIRNYIGAHTYGTSSAHANACISGMSEGKYNASVGYWSSATVANSNSFTNLGTPGYLFNSASWGTSGDKSLNIPNAGSTRAQTYPVSFSVGANTHIGDMVVTKKTSFYGIMSITFSAYGIPTNICCSVLSKNMWDVKEGSSGNSSGADSISGGGQGKQKAGTDKPYKPINRNTNGGILTDPTTSPGFVIYKFTPAQFTDFLNKVYTETSLPVVGSALSGIVSEIGAQDSLYQKLASYINTGWSDTENIVFVKTSPVSFPSVVKNLSKLSIGALGISNVSAEVVQEYITGGTASVGSFGSQAQWFTDVEPYASASIYFPLAGSIAIPPSILENSSGTIRYTFNLLNNGCGYSLELNKNNSYMFYAKNGECAKSADCVIPGRDISGSVGALGALAATGIATLATGGTAMPSLLTTAMGAATTAVHDAVDMSISNLPPSSSGSPYDDTVNGGLRDIFLYRPKAVRFNSGESGNNNQRSHIIGTFSYKYVENLNIVDDGNYFSVMDVKLDMQSGMTKAENDKIIALLKEGVYM